MKLPKKDQEFLDNLMPKNKLIVIRSTEDLSQKLHGKSNSQVLRDNAEYLRNDTLNKRLK